MTLHCGSCDASRRHVASPWITWQRTCKAGDAFQTPCAEEANNSRLGQHGAQRASTQQHGEQHGVGAHEQDAESPQDGDQLHICAREGCGSLRGLRFSPRTCCAQDAAILPRWTRPRHTATWDRHALSDGVQSAFAPRYQHARMLCTGHVDTRREDNVRSELRNYDGIRQRIRRLAYLRRAIHRALDEGGAELYSFSPSPGQEGYESHRRKAHRRYLTGDKLARDKLTDESVNGFNHIFVAKIERCSRVSCPHYRTNRLQTCDFPIFPE